MPRLPAEFLKRVHLAFSPEATYIIAAEETLCFLLLQPAPIL
jgi:hypothetical protein